MADLQDLRRWAASGESATQEFKIRPSSGCIREAGEAVSAFLNTRGGRVLFGVDDNGSLVGQSISDKTLREVSGELGQHLDPPAFPRIEAIAIDGSLSVVAVETDRGARRPHSFRGKAYRRVGTTTVELTRDQYNEMLLEQLHSTSRWENQLADEWSIRDLDEGQIVRAVEDAVRRGRLAEPGTRDVTELLRGLGLISRDQLLRAAVVLFARSARILPDYPQCRVRLARFKGVDKTEFVDNRQYEGNAFDLLVATNEFLRQHLPALGA